MRGRKRLRKWREEPRYNLLALKQMIDRWYERKMPPRNTWSFFQQSNAVADVSDGKDWFLLPQQIAWSNKTAEDVDISIASCEAAFQSLTGNRPYERGTEMPGNKNIRYIDNYPRVIISRYPLEITNAILESVS